MVRVTIAHVRHAWRIRLPGENCEFYPGYVPDKWLLLDCVYTDPRGNKKFRSVYGPASRKAIDEAYRIRLAGAEQPLGPEGGTCSCTGGGRGYWTYVCHSATSWPCLCDCDGYCHGSWTGLSLPRREFREEGGVTETAGEL